MPPHQIVIDLGARRPVKGIRYLARQDRGWNGAMANVEVYLSDHPEVPAPPVTRGTFSKVKTPQDLLFDAAAEGRYLTLRVLSEVNGGPAPQRTSVHWIRNRTSRFYPLAIRSRVIWRETNSKGCETRNGHWRKKWRLRTTLTLLWALTVASGEEWAGSSASSCSFDRHQSRT